MSIKQFQSYNYEKEQDHFDHELLIINIYLFAINTKVLIKFYCISY